MLRQILSYVLIAGLAVAGGYLGVRLAQRRAGQAPPAHAQRTLPEFLLASVATLPNVQLMTADGGAPRATQELLGRGRTVVLFLDLECEPCMQLSSRWQAQFQDAQAAGIELLGIAISPRAAIEAYRARLGLEFPIAQDALHAYASRYGVDTFPWELVVDRRGNVLHFTGNIHEMGKLSNALEATAGG